MSVPGKPLRGSLAWWTPPAGRASARPHAAGPGVDHPMHAITGVGRDRPPSRCAGRRVGAMSTASELHGPPHVKRYLATDGEDGYHWRRKTTILILFTKGRKTGEQRSHALIFRPHGRDYLIVASK